MSTIAAFIIGVICGVTLYALLDCAYCWGKRVGRELATARTDARERERTDVECCGGAHPPG